MFNRKQIRSLCFMIIISVLLMGVCPTGFGADSFFASIHSYGTGSTGIRPTSSTPHRAVAYTREVVPESETTLTPVNPPRRINMRHGSRECFFIIGILCLSSFFSSQSRHHTGHLFDEILSNTVIVCYIHHQDGAKAN